MKECNVNSNMLYMNTQCFPKLMKKCCICSNDKNVNKSQILWWHTNNKIHIKWRNAQKLLHFIWINTTIIVYQALIRVKYKWNIVLEILNEGQMEEKAAVLKGQALRRTPLIQLTIFDTPSGWLKPAWRPIKKLDHLSTPTARTMM